MDYPFKDEMAKDDKKDTRFKALTPRSDRTVLKARLSLPLETLVSLSDETHGRLAEETGSKFICSLLADARHRILEGFKKGSKR